MCGHFCIGFSDFKLAEQTLLTQLLNLDTQNCLVLQQIQSYFKIVSANDINLLSQKPKGLSDENIKPPSTSNTMFNPSLDYVGTKVRVKFNGDCLK